MCKKLAEENVVEGIDSYMKRYTLSDDIADMNTLNSRLEDIDEIYCLALGIVYRRYYGNKQRNLQKNKRK